MWGSILKSLDHTVTPPKAISHWHGEPQSLKLINDGINVVYYFRAKGEGRYLRITHDSLKSHNQLEGAIDYQKHLYEHEAPVCKPLVSKEGNYIETITQNEISYLAHVSKEVPGTPINFNLNEKIVYYNWGCALAQLHNGAKSYQPEADFSFSTYHQLHDELKDYLKSEDERIHNHYNAISNWLKDKPKSHDTYGLTHGDHRDGNVILDDNTVHIIDFDEPLYHWYLADVTRPLLNLYMEQPKNHEMILSSYLDGYNSIMPLDSGAFNEIPYFIKMKALDMYLWTKHKWGRATIPGGIIKTSIWQNKLKILIEQNIQI